MENAVLPAAALEGTAILKAIVRTDSGKGPTRRLRAAGFIPTVAYGRGADTVSMAVTRDAIRAILLSDRGRNTVIKLDVDGGEPFAVMVKDYDVHPVTRRLLHVDFLRIDEHAPIEVEVPFRTRGKSKGEQAGGTLLCSVRTLRVRCLPSQIPSFVEHDVSDLEIDDVVRAKELTLPEGIIPLLPPERKVVVVQPPRIETEVEVAAEAVEGEVPAEGETPAEGEEKPDATS